MLCRSWTEKGYKVVSQIGKGGSAEVYILREQATGRYFAGKTSSQGNLLEQESFLMKKTKHPLFPKWYDFWRYQEEAFLVMEYIKGSMLASLLKEEGKLTQSVAVYIAMELADGLAWLHECNPPVIYRDLKPANIIIQLDGRVRLIDLGASGSQPGLMAGTAGYAAPEIYELGEQNAVSDVFSLGKVLHYMLTGMDPCMFLYEQRPIRAYDRRLWRGLEQIVERCLSHSPENRIPGMRELIRQLAVYHERPIFQIYYQEARSLLKIVDKVGWCYEKNVWKV